MHRLAHLALAAAVLAAATACSAAPAPTGQGRSCMANVPVKHPPRLTLSTNSPAVAPWWGGDPATQFDNEPPGGSGWQGGEPYSMEGFEGGMSYAIGNLLGYEYNDIDWLPSAGDDEVYSAGSKPFDFYIAHAPVRADRAATVDFSEPYIDTYQAVVTVMSSPLASATSVGEVRAGRLGVVDGTSSNQVVNEVVRPTTPQTVYPDNDAAMDALEAGEVDGLVVDMDTALFMRDGWHEYDSRHLNAAKVIGRFATTVWTDHIAVVLEKGSALTPCVNAAIAELKTNGLQGEYIGEYLSSGDGIPVLQ
jgi:polar amino acid transport system substrate-binding protein